MEIHLGGIKEVKEVELVNLIPSKRKAPYLWMRSLFYDTIENRLWRTPLSPYGHSPAQAGTEEKMRRFWSYGPVDDRLHYYAPRKDVIASAYTRLTGENPQTGGHYITIWSPRQCGKTWLMIEIYQQLLNNSRFDVVPVSLESLKDQKNTAAVIANISKRIGEKLGKDFLHIDTEEQFQEIFRKGNLDKPLILILDEFDALEEDAINTLVSAFRNIYIERGYEKNKNTGEKSFLLHAVALVGVRAVLGLENKKGSPFNVQHSLHVSNLSYDEVKGMFAWYEKDTGQKVEDEVLEQLFYETRGQPGLIGWLGELLTDTYNHDKSKPITLDLFKTVIAAATKILPNNNILNLISKADEEPYKQNVLELFKTDRKIEFAFDNKRLNYLYMNGIIDYEVQDRTEYYVRFACPMVQKRLFNYFANEIFPDMGTLHEPFDNLADTIDEETLNPRNLLKRYQDYFKKNRDWLLKHAPRKSDMRVYEAVYHFNLFSFLDDFLKTWGAKVVPEFPTGNGKIDLTIFHGGNRFGLELKSYTNEHGYKKALAQAAGYGKQLKLEEVYLVFFVEAIDDSHRKKYEKEFIEKETGVTVKPVFIETGN